MVPEEQFSGTQQKINGFKAAYGTVSALCFGLLVWGQVFQSL
jgi:predicted oxidoreductase (fatty acid repression mutant protein)